MYWTIEKLKMRIPEIAAAAVQDSHRIDVVLTCVAPGAPAESAMSAPPPVEAEGWTPVRIGERWGVRPGADPNAPVRELDWGIPADGGSNHWLRATINGPESCRGKQVILSLTLAGTGPNS